MLGSIPAQQARAFIGASSFIWHQRFELAPGVTTPGVSDVGFLLSDAGVPADLNGRTVLDIGTANGGCAFEAERRGAARVVAVDIYPPDRFGFDAVRSLCGSRVAFVRGTIYELPELLRGERFDLVFFFGVLYHLRHPLLALDRLRSLTAGEAAVETAVCDHEGAAVREGSYVRFYRGSELAGDGSNWFAPSTAALKDWMASCGFEVVRQTSWPAGAAARAMICGRPLPGPPEYQHISYEREIVSVRTASDLS